MGNFFTLKALVMIVDFCLSLSDFISEMIHRNATLFLFLNDTPIQMTLFEI